MFCTEINQLYRNCITNLTIVLRKLKKYIQTLIWNCIVCDHLLFLNRYIILKCFKFL